MKESLFSEMVKDINSINREFGDPTFQWNGGTYKGVPNSYKIQRDLAEGGFVVDLMLELTVGRYEVDLNEDSVTPVFPNDIVPTPQETLTYNGLLFRIKAVTNSPVLLFSEEQGISTTNGALIKIIAVNITHGF